MEDHYETLISMLQTEKSFVKSHAKLKGTSSADFVKYLLDPEIVRGFLLFGKANYDSANLYCYVLTGSHLLQIKHREHQLDSRSLIATNSYDRYHLSEINAAQYEHTYYSFAHDGSDSLKHQISLKLLHDRTIKFELDDQSYWTHEGTSRETPLLLRFINILNRAVMEHSVSAPPLNQGVTDDTNEDQDDPED